MKYFTCLRAVTPAVAPLLYNSAEEAAKHASDPSEDVFEIDDSIIIKRLYGCGRQLQRVHELVPGSPLFRPGITEIPDYAYENDNAITELDIPVSVTSIGKFAFARCVNLVRAKFHDGITDLGDCALQYCSRLVDVSLPSSLTSVPGGFFWGCRSLAHVIIPSGVTYIGLSAFRECPSLAEISFPDGLLTVDSIAFLRCTGLRSVTIPATVTTIRGDAFDECPALTDIYYKGTPEQWESLRSSFPETVHVHFENKGSKYYTLASGIPLTLYDTPEDAASWAISDTDLVYRIDSADVDSIPSDKWNMVSAPIGRACDLLNS